LLESPEVLLSSYLLSRLAEKDVLLLACDKKHLPCMAGVPFAGHSRLLGVQRMQLNSTEPFHKRCWQAVVRQKIANQGQCLSFRGVGDATRVSSMVEMVTSGDSLNIESVAAREHFTLLFGKNFSREEDDWVNSALDYGYAVLRAAVARSHVVHGFLLSHGIHHHSELNQFNLADDFLEPLRPLVDLCVAGMEPGDELTKRDRETLVALLYSEVKIDGKRQAALHATEIMASSFLAACREKDPRLLKLPELLPLQTHSYE